MADPVTWTVASIIGVSMGAASMLESGVFMFGFVDGLRPKNPPLPDKGEPWSAWIQSGLDGATNSTNPDDEPLQKSAGPFPNIYLFNDIGHYLGRPLSKNSYVKSNTVTDIDLYPNNLKTDEGQDATIAILSARDGGRDGMLITEIGFGFEDEKQFRSGPYGINAHTFVSCGAPWYPSGIYRPLKQGGVIEMPGFWLGGEHGLGAIQIHGPSHTYGKTGIDYDKYAPGKNASEEDIFRDFCEHPGRLSFHKNPIPEEHIKKHVFTDLNHIEDRTRSVTAPWTDSLRYSGRPGPANLAARSSDSLNDEQIANRPQFSPGRKLLTIVNDDIGGSAKQVCQSTTSFGPDYVNVREGLFCRMEDRKLFLLCQQFNKSNGQTGAQSGECFDMETKQIGWMRSDPTSRPRRIKGFERRWRAQRRQVVYDGELRSGGDGWTYSSY